MWKFPGTRLTMMCPLTMQPGHLSSCTPSSGSFLRTFLGFRRFYRFFFTILVLIFVFGAFHRNKGQQWCGSAIRQPKRNEDETKQDKTKRNNRKQNKTEQTETKRNEEKKRNETKRNKTKRNKTKRNEANETKRNETRQNEAKQNETKRSKTKRNKTKRNKTRRTYVCMYRKDDDNDNGKNKEVGWGKK